MNKAILKIMLNMGGLVFEQTFFSHFFFSKQSLLGFLLPDLLPTSILDVDTPQALPALGYF